MDKGTHDFYALAGNIGEKNGNGIISFSGRIKVELFPNDGDMILTNRKVDINNQNMLDTNFLRIRNFLHSNYGGTAILEMNGNFETSPKNRIILNISPANGNLSRGAMILQSTSEYDNKKSFSIRKVFYVGSGDENFDLTSETISQDGNGIASIKGNFTMKFIGNFEDTQIYSTPLPSMQPTSEKFSIGKISFTSKSPGKLLLSAIGIVEAEWGKTLKFGISHNNKSFWQDPPNTMGPFYSNGYYNVPLPFAQDTLLEFGGGG